MSKIESEWTTKRYMYKSYINKIFRLRENNYTFNTHVYLLREANGRREMERSRKTDAAGKRS